MADFSSLTDGRNLNILINNAGMCPPTTDERTMCSHNPRWEIGVATNCFGPILLADLLKEDLKKAATEEVIYLVFNYFSSLSIFI